jgi:hypothetical protein
MRRGDGTPPRTKISVRCRRTDIVCERGSGTVWPSQRIQNVPIAAGDEHSIGIVFKQSN